MNKNENKRPLSPKQLIVWRDPAQLFVALMSISVVVYVALYLIIGNGGFADMFFLRNEDLFMDYFNSVRDAAQGAAVYTERLVIYPPLANLIFLAISRFAPQGYNSTAFADRKEWVNYPSAILLFTLIAILCAITVYTVFRENLNRKKIISILFGFFAVFNASTLHMLERGNILVLCLISVAIFAFTYNSESKVVREIGIIALATASALKLYPILFAWLFISDKRYKDLAKCLVYFSLLMIIPSFFFGGPECLITLMKNTLGFSAKKSSDASVLARIANFIRRFIPIPSILVSLLAYLWCFINLLSFMASPFLKEERWKTYIKGIILVLTLPALTSQYVWSFFLIGVVLLCNEKKIADKKDMAFVIPIFIPLLYTLFRVNYHMTVNSLLVYVFAAILSMICVWDTVCSLRKLKANN